MDEIAKQLTELPDWVYYAMLAIGGGGYAWSQGWLAKLFTAIDDRIDLPDFTPDPEPEPETDWELEYFQALRLLLSEVEEGEVNCEKYTKALRDAADHFLNRHEAHE